MGENKDSIAGGEIVFISMDEKNITRIDSKKLREFILLVNRFNECCRMILIKGNKKGYLGRPDIDSLSHGVCNISDGIKGLFGIETEMEKFIKKVMNGKDLNTFLGGLND